MRYDLIKIYTSYHKKGTEHIIKSFDCDTEKSALDQLINTKDKSNYYYLILDKKNGKYFVRGKRKKVLERLMDCYSDSKESYDFILRLKDAFKVRKYNFEQQYKNYMKHNFKRSI